MEVAALGPRSARAFPRRLWLALWPAGLLVGLAAGAIVVTSDRGPVDYVNLAAAVVVCWAFVAAGLIAWRSDPSNALGKLLTAVGFTWALGSLTDADASVPFTLGLATSAVTFGFLWHVLLAYPSGRLTSRFDRAVVVLAYLDTTVLRLPWLFTAEYPNDRCTDCPANALLIADRPLLASISAVSTNAIGIGGVVYVVTRFVQRWRAASPRGRRVLAPVLVSGGFVLVVVLLVLALEVAGVDSDPVEWLLLAGLLAVPASFVLGLARTRRAAVGASRLVTRAPTTPTPEEVQEGLRSALGDPTLRLALPSPYGGFVDPAGRPVDVSEGEGRAVTEIEREGATVAALVHDEALRNEPELVDAVVAAARISIEHDLLRAAVAREGEFLRAVVDTSPGLLCVLDADGLVRRHNRACREVEGWDEEERLHRAPFWELLGDPEARPGYEGLLAGAPSYEHESELTMRDGSRRLFKWSATPLVGATGAVEHVVCAGLDVTELKAKADELRRERDFSRTVTATTPSLLFILDEAGRIRRGGLNRAAYELFGGTESEAAGERFVDLVVPPAERDEVDRLILGCSADAPLEREGPWIDADGAERWIAWSCRPMRGRQGLFLVCGNDLTERRRAEFEVQRGREMLDTVGAATPSLLVVLHDDGRFAEFEPLNPATQRTLGYRDDEVVNRDFVELFIAPEDAAVARDMIARATPGTPAVSADSTWVTSGDERLLVAWSVTHLAHRDDGARRWLLVAGTDITERKRHEDELRASRARLVETADAERRRLERNLHDGAQQRLVALSLTLRLLEARLAADPEAAVRLAEIREQLAVALDELRDLARGIHPAVLSDHGLGPALDTLAERVPVPVEIRRSLDERLPEPVEVAAYYVVSESLANVQKYARASQVTIDVGRRDGFAVVAVSDDGVGGADAGGGSGLRGLSDRVEALGGRLEVESAAGSGTTVRALIPA